LLCGNEWNVDNWIVQGEDADGDLDGESVAWCDLHSVFYDEHDGADRVG
jgi:hypothetical protein